MPKPPEPGIAVYWISGFDHAPKQRASWLSSRRLTYSRAAG